MFSVSYNANLHSLVVLIKFYRFVLVSEHRVFVCVNLFSKLKVHFVLNVI